MKLRPYRHYRQSVSLSSCDSAFLWCAYQCRGRRRGRWLFLMGNGYEPVRRGLETSAYGGKIRQRIRHIRVRPLSAGNHTGGKWRDSRGRYCRVPRAWAYRLIPLIQKAQSRQGCKYFASLLSSAESQGIEDINVVVQSYNYGGGYIDYVAKNGKKHSFTLGREFRP